MVGQFRLTHKAEAHNMIESSLLHLYLSPGHNFFGHHGCSPGTHATEERLKVRCVADRGLEGDRFFSHEPGHKGQITFFAAEVYDDLCRSLKAYEKSPGGFRRNVVTRGIDLGALIGTDFALQGVRFYGVSECAPCHWMNDAFHPEAEGLLRGRGGLRAKILSDGELAVGAARLEILSAARKT
jgi:MOSC domain-containing protein YiiM